MKAVIDTNVLISGIFFTGPPSIVLQSCQNGTIDLHVSTEILEEYYRVAEELSQKFRNVNLKPVLDFIAERAIVIDSPTLQEKVCSDPDDDKFFACAIAGRAKLIRSGDKSLLRASGYRGILVIRPKSFVEQFLL